MKCNHRTSILVIVLVVLGLYYPLIHAPYNSVDDVKMVVQLLNTEHLDLQRLFIPQGKGYYYRPLLILTYWLDKLMWGLEESFMHLGNVLIHLGNALLVYIFARSVFSRIGIASPLAALMAALLFGVHPLNSESINWISGRSDLLAGSFVLLTLIFFTKSLWEEKPVWSLVATMFLVLGCLVKESALFVLPGALILIFLRGEANNASNHAFQWPKIRHMLSGFVLAAGGISYLLLRSVALSGGDSGVGHAAKVVSQTDGFWHAARIFLKVSGFYLKKLFIPWPLNFGISNVSDGYVALGLILVVVTIVLALRRDLVSIFFLISISIGSSALLVAFGKMAWTPIAERYMYMPSMTFSIGLIGLWIKSPYTSLISNTMTIAISGILLLVLSLSTADRNRLWLDNLSLYEDTVMKSPEFIPAQNQLAQALLKQGRRDEAFEIIKSLAPPQGQKNWELADINKAKVLLYEGKTEEAFLTLEKILNLGGTHGREALGLMLEIAQRKFDESKTEEQSAYARKQLLLLIAHYEKAAVTPFDHYRMGQIYLSLNMNNRAKYHFLRASEQAPLDAYYREPARRLAERIKSTNSAEVN